MPKAEIAFDSDTNDFDTAMNAFIDFKGSSVKQLCLPYLTLLSLMSSQDEQPVAFYSFYAVMQEMQEMQEREILFEISASSAVLILLA